MKCAYCMNDVSPSDHASWETVSRGVQQLAIPRCAQCAADRSTKSRLLGFFGFCKRTPAMSATLSLDKAFPQVSETLDARAKWTEQWKNTTNAWRNCRPQNPYQDHYYVHASDLGHPASWPSGRLGATEYFYVKFKEDPTNTTEALKAFFRYFEEKPFSQCSDDLAQLIYAHIGLIELRQVLWDERPKCTQRIIEQINAESQRCFSCKSISEHLSPVSYVACECQRLKPIGIFSRYCQGIITPELRLYAPKFSCYIKAAAEAWKKMMPRGEVDEYLKLEIESAGLRLYVGAGPCFVGLNAEALVCPLCAHSSLVDRNGQGKLNLRRAILLSENIWAFPRSDWLKGSLVWSADSIEAAEVRQFDEPCAPMPPGSEYAY